ncbi:uncharacterized protein [Haliotis cracherodii]|uniref:uncharacterized protein n=1 Tax=Haliotis cracherodii TaxID=6455 RepID=UPI0039ED8C17
MSGCTLLSPVKGVLFFVNVVAVFVNIVHMIAVKPQKKAANASDVLQWAKTTVAVLALLIVVPLHSTVFSQVEQWPAFEEVAAVLLQHFLVDFYPLGLLALAVTRLRVCLCKGNADVLITKMSAFLTLGLCLLPLSISVILNAFISFNIADSGSSCLVHYCINTTRTPGQNLQSWFHLFTIITFDILPVILTFVLYGVIQKTYRESENNIQRRRTLCGTQQRRMTIVLHRKSGRSIGLSLFLLTFTILIAWTPYVALRLMSWLETPMNQGMHHAMTLYCIVFLYLLSPVGEGLLLSQKRENVSDIFKSAYAAIQKDTSVPNVEAKPRKRKVCFSTDAEEESFQVQVKKRRSGSVCAPMQNPHWRREIQQQEYGPQNNGSTSGAVSPTRLYNQPPKVHFDEAEAPSSKKIKGKSEDVRQDSKAIQKGRPPKLADYF